MSGILRFSEANPLRIYISSWQSRNALDPEYMPFADFSEPFADVFRQPFQKSTDDLIIQFDSSFDLTNNWAIKNEAGSTISSGAATEKVDRTTYKTYEINPTITGLADGVYYLEVTGSDADTETFTALSEKFEIVTTECDTILISYYNNEVAFGIDYRTELTFNIRVPGRFNKEASGSDIESTMDTAYLKTTLFSQRNKARMLELGNRDWPIIPQWLIEKVNMAMIHDYCDIDGVRIAADQQLQHSYEKRTLWGNPSVKVPLYEGTKLNIHDSATRETLP